MPLPTIIYGILLSTLEAAVYHLVRGGNSARFAIFLVLSWIGFWIGDSLGWYMGWTFMSIGLLNAGMGTCVSILLMLLGDLVSKLATDSSRNE